MNLVDKDRAYVWHPFTQMHAWQQSDPIIICSAEGNELIDLEGRRYLDGVSSLWTNVHGHRRRELDDAIRAQLDRVAHSTLLGLGNVPSIELAERLLAVAPRSLGKVFYSDSGSTAVEVALKIAFQAHRLANRPERARFVTLKGAYHGDTIGSVSVGGIDLFHAIFHPLLFTAHKIDPDANQLADLLAREGTTIAALIVEPLMQGASGMRVMPRGFLRAARELTRRYGVSLICDEVATGFGRTGTMFACEQEDVAPDLLCLAKGISGGYLPLAATLVTNELYNVFSSHDAPVTFFHGHTYTGNPLACAAGIASLDLFARDRVLEQLPSKIALLTSALETRIRPLAHVREIRQVGLMIGIELDAPEGIGARVCQRIRKHGVLLRPLGNVIVWMPPLSITADEIARLAEATRAGIAEELGA